MPSDETFNEWAILELFGRVRLAGKVSEALIAGAPFIRLDIPSPVGESTPVFTRYFGASAIYSISPVSEAIARAAAARCQPEPVQRYGLLPAPPRAQEGRDIGAGWDPFDHATQDEFSQ